MNILICEDDEIFANKLKKDLSDYFKTQELSCDILHYSSGLSLQTALQKNLPADLLFMDIQLGDDDGIELVKQLRQNGLQLPTVFLTAMEDRIAEGYDVSAFSFLFKRDYQHKLPHLMERFLKEEYYKRTLVLKEHGNLLLLSFSDIYYVEANKRTTLIHLEFSVQPNSSSIQNFAKLLPEDLFMEAYHALYVNVDHIRKVDSDSIILDNNQVIPVSRRKRKDLMTAIMRRIRNR